MKAFALAASSMVLGLLLLPACGSSSGPGGKASTGGSGGSEAGGDGGTSGSGGASAGGATAGSGGTAGATAGTGGSATPDAASSGMPDAAPALPDATSQGGSGGEGGGSQGGAGGAADGGPVGADTWETFAKGFFSTYCVSCHNDDKKGDAARDYHVMANVMKEKAEIACGVSKSQADFSKRGCSGFPPARQFPVGSGPKPSDADRDRLVRWIDSGTP